ncbi:uncharacterized protein KY384_004028 [Bacidia gigantensis]|uniref:uncharacterized protein n=1 Tax=Bacidia gigantensis TaxID=2732470 RepID=UPI001D043A30|nr:uncharacterized protein KY384_004028 [Bacidia gigantensis]KAG8530673.1 hypothetical protein KY384_004028 [Bacidia gigantensis]
MTADAPEPKANAAIQFTKQAEKLSLQRQDVQNPDPDPTTAIKARFITPQDPVIETANGERLPTVPLKEAIELNKRRERLEEHESRISSHTGRRLSGSEDSLSEASSKNDGNAAQSSQPGASFRSAIPPQRTHPLFPDLPL